jgi:hypothetical protein
VSARTAPLRVEKAKLEVTEHLAEVHGLHLDDEAFDQILERLVAVGIAEGLRMFVEVLAAEGNKAIDDCEKSIRESRR